MAYVTAVKDGTVLSTISHTATTTGAAVNTGGYGSLAIQISSPDVTPTFNLLFEGSNDGTNWFTAVVNTDRDLKLSTAISQVGIYVLKTSTLFNRYRVVSITGTVSVVVVGRVTSGRSASDNTASVISPTAMMVNVSEGLLKDSSNAVVLSDAPTTITLNSGLGDITLINTTGYNSLSITSVNLLASIASSDDNLTWTNQLAFDNNGALTNTIYPGGRYTIPCTAKYIHIVNTTAGTATGYLRTTQVQLPQLSQAIVGNAAIDAGLAGTTAVGGGAVENTSLNYNPVAVAGVDAANLVRAVLTDSAGRVVIAGTDNVGLAHPLSTVYDGNNNLNPLAVSDTTEIEGSSQIEILANVLLELRIMNQYLFNLPVALNYPNATLGDEPNLYRKAPQELML